MCLTIPKKVIAIKDDVVTVELPNGSRQEMKSIVDLVIGDFCLSQQNVIVEKIAAEEAEEVLKMLKGGEYV